MVNFARVSHWLSLSFSRCHATIVIRKKLHHLQSYFHSSCTDCIHSLNAAILIVNTSLLHIGEKLTVVSRYNGPLIYKEVPNIMNDFVQAGQSYGKMYVTAPRFN